MPRLSDEPALNTPTLTVPAAGWSEDGRERRGAGGREGGRDGEGGREREGGRARCSQEGGIREPRGQRSLRLKSQDDCVYDVCVVEREREREREREIQPKTMCVMCVCREREIHPRRIRD